jgi:hypothetical protein
VTEQLVGIVVVGCLALIFGILFVTFRKHDPKRARASTETRPDGTFELAIAGGVAGERLFFRFEIDGKSTDDDYAIAVLAEAEQQGRVVARAERHTSASMDPIGSGPFETVGTTFAVTMAEGSFELMTLPGGDCVVRGRVRADAPTVLKRGSVYLIG